MSAAPSRGRRYYQMLGVVFLLVVALFLSVTIGSYAKLFSSSKAVTLKTDRVGNQMREGADVKARGVVVGEVRSVRQASDHAEVQLALYQDQVNKIPANITARLLPKTLFGERYVSLQPPHDPVRQRLDSGAVIGQDRSRSAIETEQVLQTLMPVLRTLQPDKVASTLGAVSQSLRGRGAKLGETLVGLGDYLRRIEPDLPNLQHVVRRLDDVSRTYTRAGPDLLRALDDLGTTSRTLAEQRDDLRSMVGTMTSTSTNLDRFVRANRQNFIDLTSTGRSTLELLGRYAPEYPCLIGQLADSIPNAERSFGKGTKHPNIAKFTIEITGSRGKYVPGVDTPRYQDTRGPRCYPWVEPPNVFPQYPPGGPIKDGSTHPEPPKDTVNFLPGMSEVTPPSDGQSSTTPQSTPKSAPTVANSPAEQRLLAALLAPSMRPGGASPEEVPRWSGFLVGPLFRGAEVTVR